MLSSPVARKVIRATKHNKDLSTLATKKTVTPEAGWNPGASEIHPPLRVGDKKRIVIHYLKRQ